ncbi:MAG TPA: hypothetical protein VFX47_07245 [Gammaproteobacteria bacterium]|nr:hypothetical protein [Gammaproteobacteria bacterium]
MNTLLKPYVALGKRELWEHRSFWIVQLVIVGIATLLTLWGAGVLIYAHYNGYLDNVEYVEHLGALDPRMFRALIIGSAVPFNIALVALVCFYLIDTLNADRRDRSVLFWRSLPVSDTATVLSKLFTALVTAPVIMLVLFIGYQLIAGIVLGIANLAIGVNPFTLFHPLAALLAFLTLAWALIAQSLWLLPFYGWFMLCSAWAKRNVWGWVILIPLGIFILEAVVFRTTYFGAILGHHVIGLAGMMVGKGGFEIHAVANSTMPSHSGHLMSLGSVSGFMLQPEMLIGIVIGVIFIAGAIWLRRNRNEI